MQFWLVEWLGTGVRMELPPSWSSWKDQSVWLKLPTPAWVRILREWAQDCILDLSVKRGKKSAAKFRSTGALNWNPNTGCELGTMPSMASLFRTTSRDSLWHCLQWSQLVQNSGDEATRYVCLMLKKSIFMSVNIYGVWLSGLAK